MSGSVNNCPGDTAPHFGEVKFGNLWCQAVLEGVSQWHAYVK
jgi:hypothetical protein